MILTATSIKLKGVFYNNTLSCTGLSIDKVLPRFFEIVLCLYLTTPSPALGCHTDLLKVCLFQSNVIVLLISNSSLNSILAQLQLLFECPPRPSVFIVDFYGVKFPPTHNNRLRVSIVCKWFSASAHYTFIPFVFSSGFLLFSTRICLSYAFIQFFFGTTQQKRELL